MPLLARRFSQAHYFDMHVSSLAPSPTLPPRDKRCLGYIGTKPVRQAGPPRRHHPSLAVLVLFFHFLSAASAIFRSPTVGEYLLVQTFSSISGGTLDRHPPTSPHAASPRLYPKRRRVSWAVAGAHLNVFVGSTKSSSRGRRNQLGR